MTTRSLTVRRVATALGVVAVLALGVGSIRAAAAWTAASAPLTVAPASIRDLQADLAAERDRSAALAARVVALDACSRALETALGAAQVRIAGDTEDADAVARQMAKATKKLKKLEAAIARAERTLAARLAAAQRSSAVTTASSRSHVEHEDDEDEDEHEDDDD